MFFIGSVLWHDCCRQEFGAAAYVKDLKAGKLDAQAKVRWFVGYDSESKGYWIYWPNKRSVTVEWNVVFNEDDVLTTDDVTIIPSNTLAEGERDKIIQPPSSNNAKHDNVSEPEPEANSQPEAEPPNSIPFPSEPETISQMQLEPLDDQDEPPQMGWGRRVQKKPPGAYKYMADALPLLEVNIAGINLNDDDLDIKIELPEDKESCSADLPPDFALLGGMGTEPWLLDKALHGPNTKEWEAALDYEISQLEKLGTWDIEDLPKGHTAIPCNEVLKEKHGPDGGITSYCVRIVAGGHRQVEGVNYTETFSATTKMPTVHVVLGNAAEQDWEIEHINIKSAYLNAPLKETIYMKPPWGVLKLGQEGIVLPQSWPMFFK
jgi:Reverse transcriptase (RNA-dependent DNA polymerase)